MYRQPVSACCPWLYSCPLLSAYQSPRLSSPSRPCPGDSNAPWSPPRLRESSRPKSGSTRSSWRDAYHRRCLQTWAGKTCDVCVCVLKLQRLTGETSITGKICVFKFSGCSQGNTSLSKLQKLTDLWSFSCRCSLSYVFWGVCHDAVRNSEPVQKNLPSDYSASVFAYKTSLTMFWQKENPTSWTASKLLKGHSGNWIIYVHKQ